MSDRHILFIAGMHRSGTSALCSALESCGARFGANLLDPLAGVNEEGFWEDAEVVEINQQLLERLGGNWYSFPAGFDDIDWQGSDLADLGERVRQVLERGFGGGALEALKDPRLCITLPFWLAACTELGLRATVCVISRSPLEVARSLEARDGFPVGYGLRLYLRYQRLLRPVLPPDTCYVTYDGLLRDPVAVMRGLAARLPLSLPESGLVATVKPQLRHQAEQDGDSTLLTTASSEVDLDALQAEIERAYPPERLLTGFAVELVQRGRQLTNLGDEHAHALAVLRERDADVERLAALHRQALATIDERDEQIRDFDHRLAETGEHLGKALDRLNEWDEQLRRVFATPVLGPLLRAVWARGRG